ncbi:MAG: hypothetical protein GXW85_07945 [Clostridia bacterium]|nr:hypothetical protein [Clostridia bacterium]
MNQFQLPQNFEELKALIAQFEIFLPEDKRKVIHEILGEIEESGGIKNREQADQLLQKLLAGMGLNNLPF